MHPQDGAKSGVKSGVEPGVNPSSVIQPLTTLCLEAA